MVSDCKIYCTCICFNKQLGKSVPCSFMTYTQMIDKYNATSSPESWATWKSKNERSCWRSCTRMENRGYVLCCSTRYISGWRTITVAWRQMSATYWRRRTLMVCCVSWPVRPHWLLGSICRQKGQYFMQAFKYLSDYCHGGHLEEGEWVQSANLFPIDNNVNVTYFLL